MADTADPPEQANEKEPLSSEAAKSLTKPRWPWGAWSTLGYSLVMFIVPQILIALVLSQTIREELEANDNIGLSFGILVVGELITFGFLMSILRSKKKQLKDIFVVPARAADVLLAIPVFGLYFVGTIAAFIVADQFLTSETLEQEQEIGGFESAASSLELVLVFVGLVLIVPFIEEVLFRGFMLKGLASRLGWLPAAIISSLFFGLAHLQINVAIDTFVLGMAAAWLVYFSKSLWPAVLLHAIKNGIAFALLFGASGV